MDPLETPRRSKRRAIASRIYVVSIDTKAPLKEPKNPPRADNTQPALGKGVKNPGDDLVATASVFAHSPFRAPARLYHRGVAADDEVQPDSTQSSRVSRVPQKVTRTTSPLTPIALVVALIAVGIAVWALVSVPDQPAPVSATGVVLPGDSKDRVCRAANIVATAVQLQTNANIGSEPAAIQSVAANSRLAMVGGGEYLLSQISGDTPTDLADAARTFGTTLQQIGVNALAGVNNSDELQGGRIRDAEAKRSEIATLCGG